MKSLNFIDIRKRIGVHNVRVFYYTHNKLYLASLIINLMCKIGSLFGASAELKLESDNLHRMANNCIIYF